MIAAVVLAAGLSTRMGTPKMILPWGQTTVIGQVVAAVAQAGADPILVVTGGAHAAVQAALRGSPARPLYNPRHAEGGMLSSLQAGLAALDARVQAALVVLGDQPQVQPQVIQAVIACRQETGALLVAPSYRMRRGHPWLVGRPLWAEILNLDPGLTLKDFVNAHASLLHYVEVDTPAILLDLDTPQDYQAHRPK
jgi:molybdenum cofactor cytidylyltransferase